MVVLCFAANRTITSVCGSWAAESIVKFLKLSTSLAMKNVSSKFSRYILFHSSLLEDVYFLCFISIIIKMMTVRAKMVHAIFQLFVIGLGFTSNGCECFEHLTVAHTFYVS